VFIAGGCWPSGIMVGILTAGRTDFNSTTRCPMTYTQGDGGEKVVGVLTLLPNATSTTPIARTSGCTTVSPTTPPTVAAPPTAPTNAPITQPPSFSPTLPPTYTLANAVAAAPLIQCGAVVAGNTLRDGTHYVGNAATEIFHRLTITVASTAVQITTCGSSFDTYLR
jgi:hypothetical protein